MKVDEDAAIRAALAASTMAETATIMNAAASVADMVAAVDAGGPLSPYGQAYRQALVDVFDTLNPDEANPQIPQQIWAP